MPFDSANAKAVPDWLKLTIQAALKTLGPVLLQWLAELLAKNGYKVADSHGKTISAE